MKGQKFSCDCTCPMCRDKVRRAPHLRWRGIARSRGMSVRQTRLLSRVLRRFQLTVRCAGSYHFRFYALRGPYWRVRKGNAVPLIVDGMVLDVWGTR